MAFQLKRDKSLKANIKRLVRQQMTRAEESIRANDQPRTEIVHDIRKRFKRIRAVVRLVRPELDKATFRKENDSFRDAARPLAAVRDAKVVVEALDKLAAHCAKQGLTTAFNNLRQALNAVVK